MFKRFFYRRALNAALRELGQYECRIVRAPDGAGQYTVEFEPL